MSDSHSSFETIRKNYFKVFLALITLTISTVAVASVHFGGDMNIVVGVLIAVCKASLVVAIFMHLRYDNPRLRFFVYIPVGFFVILVLSLTVLGL